MSDKQPTTYTSSQTAEDALLRFEAEFRQADAAKGLLEQRMNELRRKKLELQGRADNMKSEVLTANMEINKLTDPLRKARENIRRIRSEQSTAKTEYFRLRTEGQ